MTSAALRQWYRCMGASFCLLMKQKKLTTRHIMRHIIGIRHILFSCAYRLVPKRIDAYASTSSVFAQFHPKDVARSHAYIGGVNWYPSDSRSRRLNLQAINVDRSSGSGTFGFLARRLNGVSLTITIGATAPF